MGEKPRKIWEKSKNLSFKRENSLSAIWVSKESVVYKTVYIVLFFNSPKPKGELTVAPLK